MNNLVSYLDFCSFETSGKPLFSIRVHRVIGGHRVHVDVQPAFRGGKRERGQPQDNSLNSPEHEVYPDPRQPPIQSLNCDVIKIEDFEIEKKRKFVF